LSGLNEGGKEIGLERRQRIEGGRQIGAKSRHLRQQRGPAAAVAPAASGTGKAIERVAMVVARRSNQLDVVDRYVRKLEPRSTSRDPMEAAARQRMVDVVGGPDERCQGDDQAGGDDSHPPAEAQTTQTST